MKIAQIVPSLKPTGPVNVALDLTFLFRQAGHEVNVYYFDDLPEAVNVPAQKIGFNVKKDWKYYDIVHSHGLRPDLFVRLWRKKMKATISTIHNYVEIDLRYAYGKWIAKFFTPLWNWACAKHSVNVVLSRDMKEYYSSFWINKNIHVIPNTRVIETGANLARQNQIKEFADKRPVVGSLSTVNSRKGLIQIIRFLATEPNWVYVHVGGGDLNELKGEANKLSVEERCLFLGNQERGWEFVPAFDVFAIPSLSEGFPLSLIEAVQLKVPVVASNISVFLENFADDEVSFFELENIASLSEAIKTADLNRDSLTLKAREKFNSTFAPSIIREKYLAAYKSVL